MATLASIDLSAIFALFKGEPGTRKSTQALSFPKPQYWISTDQKMESLILPATKWGVDFEKDVEFDDYADWDKPRAKLISLQTKCPYKTIVIDSITSIGDNINLQTTKFKTTDKNAYKIGSIAVNTIEDYKAEAAAFQELIAMCKDIHKFHKVNIVLIAHVVGQRQPKEGESKTHFARVIVTGGDKISNKIPAYCTEVYHFNITPSIAADTPGMYGLWTVHTGNDFARTSLELPNQIQFGDRPLYDEWIKPGIAKLIGNKPVSQPSVIQPSTSNFKI